MHETENADDHHFESVSRRRDIIRTKHNYRKNRRRRHKQLHQLIHRPISSDDKFDGQSIADGADDVPDVPIPVSGEMYREVYSTDSIPLQDQGGDVGVEELDEEYKESDIDSKEPAPPLSPKVIVKQTSV